MQKPESQKVARPAIVDGQAPHLMSELEVLIRARYPVIYVISWEEQRVLLQVTRIATRLNKKVFEWSVNTGLIPGGTNFQSRKGRDTATQDPLMALGTVIDHVEPGPVRVQGFPPVPQVPEHGDYPPDAGGGGGSQEHL
jgi:hypothetical protein